MKRVFLDTDVLLDFLLDRQPFSEGAARIFALAEREELSLTASALCFSNIYYVARRLTNGGKARELLQKLEQRLEILAVDGDVVRHALQSDFRDFEDAIQHFCAKKEGVSILITRNVKDFAASDLAIHTPDSFLKIIGN